jgi:molybdopterin converting factor small subunit
MTPTGDNEWKLGVAYCGDVRTLPGGDVERVPANIEVVEALNAKLLQEYEDYKVWHLKTLPDEPLQPEPSYANREPEKKIATPPDFS